MLGVLRQSWQMRILKIFLIVLDPGDTMKILKMWIKHLVQASKTPIHLIWCTWNEEQTLWKQRDIFLYCKSKINVNKIKPFQQWLLSLCSSGWNNACSSNYFLKIIPFLFFFFFFSNFFLSQMSHSNPVSHRNSAELSHYVSLSSSPALVRIITNKENFK